MIRKIGGAEGAWFPDRRPRGQEGRVAGKKPVEINDAPKEKKIRPFPGEGCGGNIDTYA